MKKIIIPILLVGLVAGAWWTVQKVQADKAERGPQNLKTATVKLATIEELIDLTGVVEPVVSTDVKSEVTGRIQELLVRNGQSVQEGDLLLELEKQERLSDLQEAERNHQAYQLRVERARRDYEREKELKAKGFTNDKAYLDARTDLEIAEIELNVRFARLEKAEETLAKTTIRAPHAGIVSHLDLNAGQVIVGATSVNEGTVLMKINDPTQLFVETAVTEIEFNKLRSGMAARVYFDALQDREFTGEINSITNYAEQKDNQRVFGVKVNFVAEDAEVQQGISANVEVPIDQVVDVPTVVLSAVFIDDGESYVYLATGDEQFEKRVVETGLRNAFSVEIVSGLEVGDSVSLVRPDDREL